MFSTFKLRLLLGLYIFLILSIPIGAYLASQQQNLTSKAEAPKKTKSVAQATPSATISPAKQLQRLSETSNLKQTPSPTPSSTSTTATSYGPTLNLRAILEGRPKNNQATRLFVGISEGTLTTNPKFLLSFTVDLPVSGEYKGLSLAGLTSGSSYTALLKGSAQIATSSAFVMSPTVTDLNGGESLILLSGDLNEDNVVNSSDYSIVKVALGSASASKNWNANADFNRDGVVNTIDLSLIIKNLGRVGASGSWVSPIPKTATASGGLAPSTPQGGYWIWIPSF